jgi:hypothetical protein
MSWLYSQALVEEYLGENSLDGAQSAPLNGSRTQQAYCAPDKMTDFSRLSRFGMTYKPLMDIPGEELSMSSVVAFHVRTLVRQEKAQELTESVAELGGKWQGSFVKYDPDSRLWKTHQCSLLGDLEPFLETWPQWGLMHDGECWEQIPLDFHITEPEFGWLPTPIATDWKGGCSAIRKDTGRQRTDSIRMYIKTKFDITYPNPNFLEALMEWPPGWTDLKPLEMDKCHSVQQLHGESSQEESK